MEKAKEVNLTSKRETGTESIGKENLWDCRVMLVCTTLVKILEGNLPIAR